MPSIMRIIVALFGQRFDIVGMRDNVCYRLTVYELTERRAIREADRIITAAHG